MNEWDVLVAGGGSAGLAAAIAAAEGGARTLLIDRAGMLGGMATNALVHTLCGLCFVRDEPEPVFANPGFAERFARRLIDSGGAGKFVRMGRVDVLPHDPVALAALADAWATATPNLEVWLHAEIVSASTDGTRWCVETACRGQMRTVSAAMAIDATGDASLAALAGAAVEQEQPERLQRPAYIVALSGVPATALADDARLRLAHAIARAVRDGQLPTEALGAAFRPAVRPASAFLTIDLAGDASAGPWDPLSPLHLASAEMTGRRTASAIVAFLRQTVPAFAETVIAAWPARAGVRESRRIVARYTLTRDDILSGADFPDRIAWATWPLEFREKPTGPRLVHPPDSRPAAIPLRSLQHRDVPNLLAAGRCIGATHDALASVRVMGTCFATGEAAGIAAVKVDALAR